MTVMLAPDILQSIKELAEEENRTPSEIVLDALQMYKAQNGLSKTTVKKMSGEEFLLSIAGIGTSEEDDVSERDEEILAAEVDPIYGWGRRRADSDRDMDVK